MADETRVRIGVIPIMDKIRWMRLRRFELVTDLRAREGFRIFFPAFRRFKMNRHAKCTLATKWLVTKSSTKLTVRKTNLNEYRGGKTEKKVVEFSEMLMFAGILLKNGVLSFDQMIGSKVVNEKKFDSVPLLEI